MLGLRTNYETFNNLDKPANSYSNGVFEKEEEDESRIMNGEKDIVTLDLGVFIDHTPQRRIRQN